MNMTETHLAEIEKLLLKISRYRWQRVGLSISGEGEFVHLATFGRVEDAEFAAASPAIVRELVEEVRRLEQELESAIDAINNHGGYLWMNQ
jgi:hypothetical protein